MYKDPYDEEVGIIIKTILVLIASFGVMVVLQMMNCAKGHNGTCYDRPLKEVLVLPMTYIIPAGISIYFFVRSEMNLKEKWKNKKR